MTFPRNICVMKHYLTRELYVRKKMCEYFNIHPVAGMYVYVHIKFVGKNQWLCWLHANAHVRELYHRTFLVCLHIKYGKVKTTFSCTRISTTAYLGHTQLILF